MGSCTDEPGTLVVPQSVQSALRKWEPPRTSIHFPDSIKEVNKFTVGREEHVRERAGYQDTRLGRTAAPNISTAVNRQSHQSRAEYSDWETQYSVPSGVGAEALYVKRPWQAEDNLWPSWALKSDYPRLNIANSSQSIASNRQAVRRSPEHSQSTATWPKTTVQPCDQKGARLTKDAERPWGRCSYSDLIAMALTTSPNRRMSLAQIYDWIVRNVPYFNDKGSYLSVTGWKVGVTVLIVTSLFFFEPVLLSITIPRCSIWFTLLTYTYRQTFQ